jgi:hypothetical protein
MMVGIVLTVIGFLLLGISLAGVALGLYMAADRRTRRRGRLFALLWVPAAAASSGVIVHDIVTFTVGLLCFLVAGLVFVLGGDSRSELSAEEKRDLARGSARNRLLDSERTTKENERNRTQGSDRVA